MSAQADTTPDRYTETPPDSPLLDGIKFTCDLDYGDVPGIYGIFFWEKVTFSWEHGHVVFDSAYEVFIQIDGDCSLLSDADTHTLVWASDNLRQTLEDAGQRWYEKREGVG